MDINTDLIEKQLVINDDNISELGNDNVERNVIKEFDFITINNIKITEKMNLLLIRTDSTVILFFINNSHPIFKYNFSLIFIFLGQISNHQKHIE